MAIKDKMLALPGVGRTMGAYERYSDRDGNFSAAAVTFYGFFSLFPLIALAAAVVAAALSPGRVQDLQDKIADEIPGIADKINLSGLVDNAGAVGLVGGVVLLFSGLGWVEAVRKAIRKMWFPDEAQPEGVTATLTAKAKDIGILAGLGLAMALSVGASTFATSVIGRISETIGLHDNPAGRILLQIAAFAVAVLASLVLFVYLLVGIPTLTMPRRTALSGALIGAIGFEILKLIVATYISGVAGKSMYGAFGVPIALLLWIYFVTRLLLFCAAWTATDKRAEAWAREHEEAERPHHTDGGAGRDGEGGAPEPAGATTASEWQAKAPSSEARPPRWRGRRGGAHEAGPADDAPSDESGGADRPDRTENAAAAPRRAARSASALRGYALGMLGTAGAGVALERLTRRSRDGR
ncbi:YihY/virulence factor BrkB family protein [Yinghuangia sp. ASG 101]|uniref:YihY/virulence factor BrkB family protein n=1 Tax=Yinghuangia sp. ASG 101 TaxID=2896848 RepID=UPI001E5EC95B|nr:YihY/virulence factor BrkB family protein [Yinghuangia sp. ASG 101]UGQ14517.1 YihY/virulence factor BrkB family protein [Yinghuangia sp. ASG 101]